jgi:hypothetical protein
VGGEGAHAGLLAQLIELDGEQAVGRLGLAVGLPFVVASLELQVVEADRRDLVPGRGKRDDACAAVARQRRPQQVREREVAEVVVANCASQPGPTRVSGQAMIAALLMRMSTLRPEFSTRPAKA